MDGAYLARLPTISADDIYATNANRNTVQLHHIVTNFKRKEGLGNMKKHRQIIQQRLRKKRDNTNGR